MIEQDSRFHLVNGINAVVPPIQIATDVPGHPDGAALLDDVHRTINRFLVLPENAVDGSAKIIKASRESRSWYGEIASISKLAYSTVKKLAPRLKKLGLIEEKDDGVVATEKGIRALADAEGG